MAPSKVAYFSRQQPMRRVGALFPLAESDPEQAARRDALQQRLEQLGWTSGRNAA